MGTRLTARRPRPDVNPATGTQHGYTSRCRTRARDEQRRRTAMGRFEHEAVAVDPATGYVDETEDDNTAGLFRFRPKVPGKLRKGGVLEMLKIGDASYSTSADPSGRSIARRLGPRRRTGPGRGTPRPTDQGIAKGGATFSGSRAPGMAATVSSTSSRPAADRPGSARSSSTTPASGRLRVLFASPVEDVLCNPDNICVSPRGGIVLCEDGSGVQFMHGLTRDGDIFPFAANNVIIPNGVPGKPAIRRATTRLGSGPARRSSPARQVAVRQHPDARHHLRHDRPLAPRLALTRPVSLRPVSLRPVSLGLSPSIKGKWLWFYLRSRPFALDRRGSP